MPAFDKLPQEPKLLHPFEEVRESKTRTGSDTKAYTTDERCLEGRDWMKFNKEKYLLPLVILLSVMKKIVYVQLFRARTEDERKKIVRIRSECEYKIENKRKTDFLFELMFTYISALFLQNCRRSFLLHGFCSAASF